MNNILKFVLIAASALTLHAANQQYINLPDSLFVKKYINDKNCDLILRNDGFFTTCYDYGYKGAVFSYAKIEGKNASEGNIKERPRFYDDQNIPKRYRSTYSDYTHTGLDRGHIQSDASWDFSKRSQLSTYAMSNILPQFPNTNRKSYLAVEKYERLVAQKIDYVNSLTIVFHDENPGKIGRNNIAVPIGFGKIFWNREQGFERCFYIPNDDKIYKLKEMEVGCDKLIR